MEGIKRVDHIAFAVKNLEETLDRVRRLYGGQYLGKKDVPHEKYQVAYVMVGQNMITLVQPTSPESFVAQFIEKRGEGIHHLGVEVDSLDETVANLQAEGVKVTDKVVMGDMRQEVLVGPKDGLGTVLELIEWLGACKDAPVEERVRLITGG
ncbi:MAG: VOC family protein [Chloroflexi bacterium]|nr:VOC family protein [Chloroflexota bacterium]